MIEAIHNRVHKLRKTGEASWIACCPAHEDNSPSLAIRLLDDGRILLHCFAGCETSRVLESLGLAIEDLFPDRGFGDHYKRVQRPFNAMDVLRCIAFEAQIAAVAASNLARGVLLQHSDHARLMLATSRLHAAVKVAEDA